MRTITIDGNTITYVDNDGASKQVDLHDIAKVVADSWQPQEDVDYSEEALLPPAVRWISRDVRQVLLERPAQLCAVHIADHGDIFIPVPWNLWFFQFSEELELCSVRILARVEQIFSAQDTMSYYPFPNTTAEGYVFDSVLKEMHINEPPVSLADMLRNSVEVYWKQECSPATNWLSSMPLSVRNKLEDDVVLPNSMVHGYQELSHLSVEDLSRDALVGVPGKIQDGFRRDEPAKPWNGPIMDTLVNLMELVQ